MRALLLGAGILLVLLSCAKPAPIAKPERRTEAAKGFGGEARRHFHLFKNQVGPALIDVKSYSLDGEFDWATLRLKARLTLVVQLLDDKNDQIVLDSKVEKVHRVVDAAGANVPFLQTQGKLTLSIGARAARAAREKPAQFVLSYETRANADKEGALIAVPARQGDPVAVRTVATFSEPLGAEEWMPCHNRPSNRATFATRFRTPAAERFISNGELTSETVTNGVRETAYATAYSLPPYLMAFAIGDFEVTTDRSRRVPLQIWHRRGLSVDARGLLRFLGETLQRFETLLVPYPFEKYALVLLPAYRSGLEHASITFQGESRSSHAQVRHDRELSAHELAHQWFGDLVTISGWDDLWVKEGMATLLAQEALRPLEDTDKRGRLFGREFASEPDEAIRDPELPPNDKYTAGPYGRAAWLYSQVRFHLGEERFWAWLRGLLERHRFSSINTDQVVQSLAEQTTPDFAARFQTALRAKALPAFSEVESKGTSLTFEFVDKDHSLLFPLTAEIHAPDGTTSAAAVKEGKNTLAIPADNLLAFDAPDIHPLQDFGWDHGEGALPIQPFLVGSAMANEKGFGTLGAANQMDALFSAKGWQLTPATFAAHYRATHSAAGRYRLIAVACEVAEGKDEVWRKVLVEALQEAPQLGLPDPATGNGWSYCRRWLTDAYSEKAWRNFTDSPHLSGDREPELARLNLVSLGADQAFEVSRTLIERGGTVRTQVMMVQLLFQHLFKEAGYAAPDSVAWLKWVREFLAQTQVEETTSELLSIVKKAKDKKALPDLVAAYNHSLSRDRRIKLYCAAKHLTKGQKGEWEQFLGQIVKPAEVGESTCK